MPRIYDDNPRYDEDGTVVYLLTTGTGEDGDEWYVEGIYATPEAAEYAKERYEAPQKRADGSSYSMPAQIERWTVEG